jgi:hypothetical protein
MKSLGKAKMMKRYADGGETVDYVDGRASETMESSSGPSKSVSVETESVSEEPSKPEYKSFKEAFAAERKAGNKTFEYMGKKYTTDMAARTTARDTGSDVARKAASYPKPAPRAQTQRDLAEAYVAKRAAARAEAAANPPRGRGGVKLANGGVVKRATATMRGKAC